MRSLIALFAVASLTFAGCAVQNDEADQGESESAADALSYASIYGAWQMQSGGAFYTIDFKNDKAETLGGFIKGHAFTATIDTGVRCIAAPCTEATATVSGVFKVSGSKLTITSFDKPSAAFGRVIGDYTATFSKVKGVETLKLVRKDGSLSTELMIPAIECGDNVCTTGNYCCNSLESHCAKMGMMCTL